ncbi:hypothetical protein [Actinocrispum sp. NPDC049592]|uniref:hypothetical protein n=1 Tax=Actinocrispum sp. NPDC049592 TaxID=3154835 RepID=UPI003428EBC2
MFAGLDDIDWPGMKHAYGSADDVPEMLRDLVSSDASEREVALDGMYGAVHHQGDIYECTIATIPFLLEAAAQPGVPGRGAILELLASYANAENDDWTPASDPEVAARYDRARLDVAAGAPVYLELLNDKDPEVRGALGKALLAVRRDAGPVVDAVLARLPGESDADVQVAWLRALGRFGTRGVNVGAVRMGLMSLSSPHPRVGLAAWTEYVRCGPDPLPVDALPSLSECLTAAYAQEVAPPEKAGFQTETLVGQLREMRHDTVSWRPAPHMDGVIREVSWAFGDLVDVRTEFLLQQLRSDDWVRRYDSLRAVKDLVNGWRGDYGELAAAVGDLLGDPRSPVYDLAADTLLSIGPLAAPAADALAESLAAAPRFARRRPDAGPAAWLTAEPQMWQQVSAALSTLAHLGDARAVPMVGWLLEQKLVPEHIGNLVTSLGRNALELLPLIKPTTASLIEALGQIGPDAADSVPDLLAVAPTEGLLRTLGRIGAAEAVPLVRGLLSDEKLAGAAAWALWRLTEDPEPVLPVFADMLAGNNFVAREGADSLGDLGPAAASSLPALRALLERPDEYGWLHLSAVTAIWRITGEIDLGTLTRLWPLPSRRLAVAETLVEMGTTIDPAIVRAEADSIRRHTVTRVAEYLDVYNSDIGADERLRRALGELLTRGGEGQ